MFKSESWEALLIDKFKLHHKKPVPTKEELFIEVKRVWDKFGRRPSYQEFRNNATIKMSVFEDEFSSWTLCIEEFCIENKSYNSADSGRGLHTSEKLLLEELKIIKKIHPSKTLTYKEYNELGGKYSRTTFINFFGNWQNAVQLVGLTSEKN